jgi:hypothetical protein
MAETRAGVPVPSFIIIFRFPFFKILFPLSIADSPFQSIEKNPGA